MQVLVPPLMSDSDMQKLPKELTIIIPYVTRLRETITSLLDSKANFEDVFNEVREQFLKYIVLVASTLKEKEIERMMAIYTSSLELKEHDNPVVLALKNANDIILEVYSLAFDPILPQYADVFEPYIDLLVCCTILLQIEDRNTNQGYVEKLIERCQENIRKLEGWISTIEIETDPEQRAILERVKSQ
jgi:hypothetical protein